MSFKDCLEAAVADGVLAREDADELQRRYARELRAANGDRATAKDALAAKLAAEGVESKRRKLLAAQASRRIADDIRGYRGPDGKPDIVDAIARLFENVGHTGYESVRGRTNALLGRAHSEMAEALHAFRRGAIDPRRQGRMVLDDVARAAFGEAADPRAEAFYKAFLKPAEKLRQNFNEAGGRIGWREDWGLPMRHDAGAVTRAGLDDWRDFIATRLDWEKMRHPASDTPILPEERADVLEHVWRSIVMDGWNTREASAGGAGRPSLANARSDARFLAFRDAASWLAYNREFGTGNVFDTMTGHIESMASDVALMQRLGPNPGATVQWLKQIIQQEGARSIAGDASLFRPGRLARAGRALGADGAIGKSIGAGANLVDAMYEMARGSGLPRSLFDESYRIFKNDQMGAKLGSAILVHAPTNPILLADATAHYGLPLRDIAGTLLKSFAGASAREMDQAGMIIGDAVHSLENGARRAGALSKVAKWSEWLPYLTTHYSGLEGTVQGLRRAWWWGAQAGLANLIERPWDGLPPRVRNFLLQGFGLGEQDWRIMQAARLYQPEGRAPFLRWQEIHAAGLDNPEAVAAAIGVDHDTPEGAIATARASEETALRYLGMLHQAQEFAVPSGRWRSTVTLQAGTKRGTPANYLLQSFAMFKGFIGSATISYLEAMRHELARGNLTRVAASGGASAGASFIALTLGGVTALQLKTMSTGKDPLPMDPRTPEGRTTWERGMMMAGLGIFNDFLAADVSSYGHSLTETLAGPMLTGASDLAGAIQNGVKRLMGGKAGKDQEGTAADALVKFARNNTPVLSTHWALRAAYNRVLLDQLQFLTDPAAHRKMRATEQRVFKETGQGYWWRPGALTPERWPRFTPGR